jgi:hypothetical protein
MFIGLIEIMINWMHNYSCKVAFKRKEQAIALRAAAAKRDGDADYAGKLASKLAPLTRDDD